MEDEELQSVILHQPFHLLELVGMVLAITHFSGKVDHQGLDADRQEEVEPVGGNVLPVQIVHQSRPAGVHAHRMASLSSFDLQVVRLI